MTQRFTNPIHEPLSLDEKFERDAEKADAWRDQAVDREIHFIALYAGTPVKLHTNLCGKWFALVDESQATKFKCERTAVSQCALHGVPTVTIKEI